MKLFLIVLSLLFICSCSSGKPQYVPPVKIVEPTETVQPEPVAVEVPEKVEEVSVVKTYAENSFLAILLKEGTPSENIIPRSKEQVAIYQKDDYFTFYYFKKNQLILRKDYSFTEIEQMKADGNYPDSALKEMGVIE